jgi:multisite-specific tRNA:(cytosine-C5)-methyltransferase
MGLIY